MKILKKLKSARFNIYEVNIVSEMSRLEFIHANKIVTKIKLLFAEDIVNTMRVICSDNKLIHPEYDREGGISIKSKVDGSEGYYHIFNLEVDLIESDETYVPRLMLTNLHLPDDEVLYLVLNDITVDSMYLNIITEKNGFKKFIMSGTQADRLDLMEKVSEVMDILSREYKFRGYTKMNNRRSLI